MNTTISFIHYLIFECPDYYIQQAFFIDKQPICSIN